MFLFQEPKPVQFDPLVTQKCLEIVYELLQDTNIKSLNPTLMTIFEELVMPSVRDLRLEVRKSAIKAMATACLRNVELAKRNILLLFQVSRTTCSCFNHVVVYINTRVCFHRSVIWTRPKSAQQPSAPSTIFSFGKKRQTHVGRNTCFITTCVETRVS